MNIHVETSDRRAQCSVHNLKPKLVDLSEDGRGPLYVMRNENDAVTTLSVFFGTSELLSLRRQIDEVFEKQKARLQTVAAAMPADLNVTPEAPPT